MSKHAIHDTWQKKHNGTEESQKIRERLKCTLKLRQIKSMELEYYQVQNKKSYILKDCDERCIVCKKWL